MLHPTFPGMKSIKCPSKQIVTQWKNEQESLNWTSVAFVRILQFRDDAGPLLVLEEVL